MFDRYHRPLLGFCQHMLGSRDEAEDALQHVFLAVHSTLRTDDRPVKLKPWLYAVAANRCTSMLRARREQVSLDQASEPSTAGLALADQVEQRTELKALFNDVAALPDDQRAALVLAELGDLDHGEIATTLGVRTDKVKALVFQARKALIGSRRARETDCVEIQEQLATLRGGALRRSPITRHVAACRGCAAFQADVRRQRAALGCVLPVLPALALKQELLASVLAGSAGGAAAVAGGSAGIAATTAPVVGTAAAGGAGLAGGGAAAAGAGLAGGGAAAAGLAGSASGVLAAAASVGAATKALVAVALAGGVLGGGVALERRGDAPAAASKTTAVPPSPTDRVARPGPGSPASVAPAANARPTTLTGPWPASVLPAGRKAAAGRAPSKRSGAAASETRRRKAAGAPARKAGGGTRGRAKAATGQAVPVRTVPAGAGGSKAARARPAAIAPPVASAFGGRKAPRVPTRVKAPARSSATRVADRPAKSDATVPALP